MIDPTIREWLYAREMLRRLGFTPDELYFSVHTKATHATVAGRRVEVPRGSSVIALEVNAQGLTFVWTIGFCALSKEMIDLQYKTAVELWNSADTNGDLMAGYLKSESLKLAAELMVALRGKGFVIRRTTS